MLDPADLRALVTRAGSGHQESWDRLVDTFSGLVWSVIRGHRLYGAEAADVSQTVWLRCVENLTRIREPERLAAWLATTARHECFRVIRRSGRSIAFGEVPEPMGPPPDTAEFERLESAESTRAVAAALELVPPRCQVLLRLLAADPPMPYDEIAQVLDMPKGGIGPTRSRCLAHLKRRLEEAGDL